MNNEGSGGDHGRVTKQFNAVVDVIREEAMRLDEQSRSPFPTDDYYAGKKYGRTVPKAGLKLAARVAELRSEFASEDTFVFEEAVRERREGGDFVQRRANVKHTIPHLVAKAEQMSVEIKTNKVVTQAARQLEEKYKPYWRKVFGENNPHVEYVNDMFVDEIRAKGENKKLMEWVEKNRATVEVQAVQKIVIVDDFSDKKVLENSKVLRELFKVCREFNFSTFLFVHTWSAAPKELRENALMVVNTHPKESATNREMASANGKSTIAFNGCMTSYSLLMKQLKQKGYDDKTKCVYVSQDLDSMVGSDMGSGSTDEQVNAESQAFWYAASAYKPPTESEQKLWFDAEGEDWEQMRSKGGSTGASSDECEEGDDCEEGDSEDEEDDCEDEGDCAEEEEDDCDDEDV